MAEEQVAVVVTEGQELLRSPQKARAPLAASLLASNFHRN